MTTEMDDQEEFMPATGETAEARLRRMSRRRGRTLRREEVIPIAFVVLAVLALLWWLVGLRGCGVGGTAMPPQPSPTLVVSLATRPREASPTSPAAATVVVISTPAPPLPTEGPSIPTTIAPGVYVKVTGTGLDQLSFRTGPGLNYARLVKPGTEDEPFLLPDGSILKVLEGPEMEDNMRWWRLQSLGETATVGWAVEQHLVPVAPPGQ